MRFLGHGLSLSTVLLLCKEAHHHYHHRSLGGDKREREERKGVCTLSTAMDVSSLLALGSQRYMWKEGSVCFTER